MPPSFGSNCPEAWPITSWKATSHLRAVTEYWRARSASSGVRENSMARGSRRMADAASITLLTSTLLLPYFSRMACSLGRLMPAGGLVGLVTRWMALATGGATFARL